MNQNGNWKGGTYRHKAGYVMMRVPSNSGEKIKYKFHHVLVMEDYLGRKLRKGENVHHKNGVKDDNRIENLELWVRGQPTGVRVEDAIAWAKEILALYENEWTCR